MLCEMEVLVLTGMSAKRVLLAVLSGPSFIGFARGFLANVMGFALGLRGIGAMMTVSRVDYGPKDKNACTEQRLTSSETALGHKVVC